MEWTGCPDAPDPLATWATVVQKAPLAAPATVDLRAHLSPTLSVSLEPRARRERWERQARKATPERTPRMESRAGRERRDPPAQPDRTEPRAFLDPAASMALPAAMPSTARAPCELFS